MKKYYLSLVVILGIVVLFFSGRYLLNSGYLNKNLFASLVHSKGEVLGSFAVRPTGNGIVMKDLSNTNQTNRPITISRVFKQGDIPGFPQAVISGTPVTTQADVKSRWPDGSVKHVMISFIIPSLSAGGEALVNFINQSTGNNSGGLLADDMLSQTYNFGASFNLSNGTTPLTADARTMIQAGAFRYWLKGSIVTQVIIEDRTPARAFDMGWDTYRSFHPIMVATFYTGNPNVKVEFIGEAGWLTQLQDVPAFDLTLKTGNPAVVAYQKNMKQEGLTRWRKTFWSGTEFPKINVNYNLPYMVSSMALPSYDTSIQLSQSAIDEEVSIYTASDRQDITGTAEWTKTMWAGGANGRGDIGLNPRWYVRYLYSFDPSMFDVMIGNAEGAAHAPIHFRDSYNDGSYFDVAHTGVSFGEPISLNARPIIRTCNSWDGGPENSIVTVGPLSPTWAYGDVDQQHQPSTAYVPYLITGDWYFLEEMYFWSSYNITCPNPAPITNPFDYVRNGSWGFLNENGIEIRGAAWSLRTLSDTAFIAPDNTPQKNQYTKTLLDNIAVREGVYNVTDGHFCSPDSNGRCTDPRWRTGRDLIGGGVPNPLVFIDKGAVATGQANGGEINYDLAEDVISSWMSNYEILALNRAEEQGFPADKLNKVMMRNLLYQFQSPDANPFMVEEYRTPTTDKNGNYFTKWTDVVHAYVSYETRLARTQFETFPSLIEGSYSHIARAAASFLPGLEYQGMSGSAAWNWMIANESFQELYSTNPKWALVPRSVVPPTPVDTTPPVISNISNSSNPISSVTITWNTDESSDSQIEYGLTSTYENSTTLVTSLVTSHSQTISGLSPKSTYHYRVKSRDGANNLAISSDNYFTTGSLLSIPSISSFIANPPTISSNPYSSGSLLSSTLSWITSGETFLSIDQGIGSVLGTISKMVNPISSTIYTLTAANSSGTTSAKVMVTVTDATPDTVPPSVPTNLSVTSFSSTQVNLSWAQSTDNVRVSGYYVYRNGSKITTSTSLSYTDSNLSPSTTYTYTVSAFDDKLNSSAQSQPVVVTTSPEKVIGDIKPAIPPTLIPPVTATSTCSSVSNSTNLSRNLSRGSAGYDVTVLQKFLVDNGYTTSDNVTGYFGLVTENSVKSFQRDNSILSSGSVETNGYGAAGPTTRAKINKIKKDNSCGVSNTNTLISTTPVSTVSNLTSTSKYPFNRNLSLEDSSEDVRRLQKFLNTNGFIISVVGAGSPGKETVTFGNMTENALKNFQTYIGFPSTGYFGPMTREYVNRLK